MAAFAIELIIVHKNVQYGFYTLLSCHHSNHGAACLFSSAIKLLMTVAIAIFLLNALKHCLIKLNFVQRLSSNICIQINAAVHTYTLSLSL